jgi:maltose O-acetyltransferase
MLTWLPQLRNLGVKFARACEDELAFDARKILANSLSRALPHFRFCRLRTALLRTAGVRIGAGAVIMGPLDLTGFGSVPQLLRFGALTYVSGPLHVDLGAEVRVGNGVRLGPDVTLLTVDHEIGPSGYRCGRLVSAPIRIGNGAWVGPRAIVLPGVFIGHGAVVAAGAVVTRDVAPNTLVAGVPARIVRELGGDEGAARTPQASSNSSGLG